MNRAEIIAPTGAVEPCDEVLQVGQSHRGCTIGHGWRAELGFGSVGVHILHVSADSSIDSQVSLARVIWLVEAHEMGGSCSESRVCVSVPGGCELVLRAPEDGDVFEARRDAGSGRCPVVGPGYEGVGGDEAREKSCVVVG